MPRKGWYAHGMAEAPSKFKKAVETLILLDRFGAALGIGGISALIFGLWAWVSQMASGVVALIAVAAFTLGLLLVNGIRAYLKARKERFPPPDYEAWDNNTVLTLKQASCMWGDISAISDRMNERPKFLFKNAR